jgi:hypothetical protein
MKKTTRRSKQSSPIDSSPSSVANEKQQYEERIRQLEQENKAYQVSFNNFITRSVISDLDHAYLSS